MTNYTNAVMVVGQDFGFEDGLFSGYDPQTRSYDRSKWAFELDDNKVPVRDPSLQHERCVFQLLSKHYSRYTLDKVSDITGVSKENLLKVYEAYAVTRAAEKSGTILYALGWTQHTVGGQNIRSAGILQLLLGNIGVAGGGINALRGEPSVQGSTDHTLLYHIILGYMATPRADWPTLADYHKANTPVSNDPQSANSWQHKPKYFNSLLKGWFGDNAMPENEFGYAMVPKLDKGVDYSYLFLFDPMYRGEIESGFILVLNPANSVANAKKVRRASSIARASRSPASRLWPTTARPFP